MILKKLTSYLILGFLSALMFIPGIARIPVIDRDEAYFAQASRQMLQTGQYFQIRFQESTRFQKPPGINWLQSACVKLFSDANASIVWPYRIPSVLGAFFSVFFTYFFSRRFVNPDVAKLAAILLASTLLLAIEAHMAVIDTMLLCSVLLMQGALWVIYQQGLDRKHVHWRWPLCFWLAMALGFVLKGVTPLIGILSIISLCFMEKQRSWLRALSFFSGLLLFMLLTCSWLFMVNTAEHSNYLMEMIHRDLLPKLQGGHESHGKPPLFHLLILPLTFWPASLLLWQGLVYGVHQRHERRVKFLLAWIVPTWLFFEMMPTKLPQYVLPTFPAIALLCALAIEGVTPPTKPGKWLHFLQALWIILSVVFVFTLTILSYFLLQKNQEISLIFLGLILMMIASTGYYAWQGFYRRLTYLIPLLALLTYSGLFSGLLPKLTPLWLTSTIVERLDKNQLSRPNPLLTVGFNEPSLVFNLNTDLVKSVDSFTAMKLLTTDSSRLALVESTLFNHWQNSNNFAILERVKGYNYSKGRWVELFLVRKEPNTGK